MSLLTYEQARPWAKAILKATENRTMPPWHTDAPSGTFHNERILTAAERNTLMAWANGGAARGDDTELPTAPAFTGGWSLGTPDLVLEMQEEYKLPATGTIQYEWFYIPTNFTESKWVKSIEVGQATARPCITCSCTIAQSPMVGDQRLRAAIKSINRIRRRMNQVYPNGRGAETSTPCRRV
jgi:hypothetical protein